MNNLREKLAEYAHTAWAGWMRYLFSKGDYDSGYWTMPQRANDRWRRQMNTAYADLPEEEKESDRQEADKILALLGDAAQLREAAYKALLYLEQLVPDEPLSAWQETDLMVYACRSVQAQLREALGPPLTPGAAYLTLRLDNDIEARKAARTWANLIGVERPELAQEVRDWVNRLEAAAWERERAK